MSTMKRKILDAFFSDFSHEGFFLLILTRHEKNKNQFFIYLKKNYLLFLLEEAIARTNLLDQNLTFKLTKSDRLIDVFRLLLFFSFFLFLSSRSSSRRRTRTRARVLIRARSSSSTRNRDYRAILLLRRETRIDRDENTRAFSIDFDRIENIVVDVSLDDAIKQARLQTLNKKRNDCDKTFIIQRVTFFNAFIEETIRIN